MIPDRPDWQQDAACRGTSPQLFFAERFDFLTVSQAQQICAICPVRAECLDYGLHERDGIWGGLAPKARREEARRRKIDRRTWRKPIKHGTAVGYRSELRQGIPPCDECRQAHALNQQYRKAQEREAS